jgi:hypothetical protein
LSGPPTRRYCDVGACRSADRALSDSESCAQKKKAAKTGRIKLPH